MKKTWMPACAGMTRSLEKLPLWVGAGVTFLGGVLLAVQLTMGVVAHGKQMKLFPDVYGLTYAPTVALSAGNVLDGAYQHALAFNIGSHVPYFPFAVRLRNQLEYTLFDVSATQSVVVGTHGTLMERVYVDDYCQRDLATYLPKAPAWASKIKTMQDGFEKRGQVFLYVVTPSKVATYPWILPPGLNCPSTTADRSGIVPDWLKIVHAAGIHVVDTVSVINRVKGDYPFMLYPKKGSHWNLVGSAIGAQTLETALVAQTHDPRLAPLHFRWRMSPHNNFDDSELTFLMNLIWVNKQFDVPVTTLTQAPAPAGCRKIKIVIVGGSFMEHLGPALSELPCAAPVVEYFYWKLRRDLWVDGKWTRSELNPAQRAAEIEGADVVLYEENEAVLGRSNHGAAFYAWVEAGMPSPATGLPRR